MRRTPLLPIELSAREGRCFLKLESMQTTGAFKFRGAYNALSALGPAERRYGVVAASTGNHAIGVARAALMLGLPATILMPATAPPVKQALVAEAGADLRLYPGGIDEATDEARHVAAMSSRTFVSSYDDPLVIAGQGTIAIEVIEQLADRHELDGTSPTFLVPVGGGGLASGFAIAAKALVPASLVYGVEPKLAAKGQESLDQDRIVRWPAERIGRTCADGLRVARLGTLPFGILPSLLDGILTVTESAIREAMYVAAFDLKVVLEPAGAVALAAWLGGGLSIPDGPVVCLATGGNVDPASFTRLATKGEGRARSSVQRQ
ncbi:MAG TPA: threonine/serine dehydratase [Candidatus Limnocylindrales bacterium]